ncbi:ribonuclease P protein component [Ahrensia sp. R2A130]|uniref:ribonuclease P protein component n=1 Tax=Ahrensia sp. R2A130 TaxID=744979 RepID=UPI0001E0E894|nr:ribonuclease P protein component [Ahrensia sp. R2A130]EFL89876.1 ribonuclease P protein component [Ahrensia sp. R2A130]
MIDEFDGGSGDGTAAPFGMSKVQTVRMKRRADFVACRKGSRVSRDAFGIQLRKRKPDELLGPGEKLHHFRVGFTVTKKIGNAVVRNRIKRRLRAASAEITVPESLAGYDAVFMANEPALGAPFQTLTAQMTQGLAKALLREVARLQNPAPRGKTRRDEGRARKGAATGAGRT